MQPRPNWPREAGHIRSQSGIGGGGPDCERGRAGWRAATGDRSIMQASPYQRVLPIKFNNYSGTALPALGSNGANVCRVFRCQITQARESQRKGHCGFSNGHYFASRAVDVTDAVRCLTCNVSDSKRWNNDREKEND